MLSWSLFKRLRIVGYNGAKSVVFVGAIMEVRLTLCAKSMQRSELDNPSKKEDSYNVHQEKEEANMIKFGVSLFVAAILCLALPARAATNGLQTGKVDPSPMMQKNDWIRIAVKHNCGQYGKAKKCKARWDYGTNQCLCVG